MRVVSGSESIEQIMELVSIQGNLWAMLSRGVQLGKRFWRCSMASGIPGMDCG